MTRVAFVTNFIPPYRESFYIKLCREDLADEWLVIHGDSRSARTASGRFLPVPAQNVRNTEWRLGPFTLRWQLGALAAVRRFRPGKIILLGISGTLSNWLVLFWAQLHGIPVIMWTCGWEPQRPRSAAAFFKNLLARQYFRRATMLLTYSSKGKSYIENFGVPARKVRICHNGIEIDHLLHKEASVRQDAQLLRTRENVGHAKVILFVGAMLPEKRLDLLIEAFRSLVQQQRDVCLWLVGDGPERASVQEMVKRLGLQHVRFFGRIVAGVEQFFAAADVVVLPGIGGLALNEAMFWGRVCVVGTADGTEDDLVLDGVTGRRFLDGDPVSLKNAISECLDLPEAISESWGKAAHELIVTRSNVSQMVSTFRQALRDVAAVD